MSVNKELKKLYEKYWDDVMIEGKKVIKDTTIKIDHPANPFLLAIDEKKYEEANFKVMIFGQETWGWDGDFGKTIDELMGHYAKSKKDYLDGRNKGFSQGYHFFQEEITEKYRNKKFIFIWNNISKIGRNEAKGQTKNIKDLEQRYFPVIKEELEILKPDMVIFLTGNRDSCIRFNFPSVQFEKYHKNATLKSFNGKIKFQPAYRVITSKLPIKSVKVYHPSYFGGFNNIKNDALDLLLSDTV